MSSQNNESTKVGLKESICSELHLKDLKSFSIKQIDLNVAPFSNFNVTREYRVLNHQIDYHITFAMH